MSELVLADKNSLFYLHSRPTDISKPSFVFINALTGSTEAWEQWIVPELRRQGFGTLSYDYRGQGQSRYGSDARLDPAEITADFCRLLEAECPQQPIFIGLSIGGLFAIEALLSGVEAAGLVLINTLRKPCMRLDWINQGMARLVAAGGFPLLQDAMLPMLVNPDKLAEMHSARLSSVPYVAARVDDPGYRLMTGSAQANWDIPYEDISVPVLIMNGLHDRIFRVAEDVTELTARIRNVESVDFSDAGHLIPAERPQAFSAALSTFAAKLSG